MKEKEYFKTYDLALAAYLKINGIEFIKAEPISRYKSQFVFEDSTERENIFIDFMNRRARVEPLQYLAIIKSLKTISSNNSDLVEGGE